MPGLSDRTQAPQARGRPRGPHHRDIRCHSLHVASGTLENFAVTTPAAGQFIARGSLERFARRQLRHREVSFLALIAKYSSSMAATTTSNQIVKFMP